MQAQNKTEHAASLSELPVLSHILTPGSSLHPTFLRVVDGVFVLLLVILLSLLVITAGNVHLIALIAISFGLWGSVKWFVNELQREIAKKSPEEHADATESRKEK